MVKMEILLPLPGTEPIPCDRHREELLSVCLASGNRRWSCYGSREQSSVTVPEHTGQIEEVSCPEGVVVSAEKSPVCTKVTTQKCSHLLLEVTVLKE